MDNYFKENRNRIEYKEILFLFSWSIGYGVSRSDLKSVSRSDLKRGSAFFGKPRHPILTECSAFRPLSWSIGYAEETSASLDRFFPLKGEAFNQGI